MIDTSFSIDELNESGIGNMSETLMIEFTEINKDFLIARMPVNSKTVQPIGILNGGASAALAETVGSLAAYLSVDRTKYYAVGLEIKCNHLRSVSNGYVYAKAEVVHLGRRTHVWRIDSRSDEGKMISTSTLTMQILELKENAFAIDMLMKSPLARFAKS